MANKINANKLGLTVGIFAALIHLIWSLVVLAGVAQEFLNWIFPIHFLNNVYSVVGFNAITALLLTLMALLGGYVMGWAFAELWNYIDKKVR